MSETVGGQYLAAALRPEAAAVLLNGLNSELEITYWSPDIKVVNISFDTEIWKVLHSQIFEDPNPAISSIYIFYMNH